MLIGSKTGMSPKDYYSTYFWGPRPGNITVLCGMASSALASRTAVLFGFSRFVFHEPQAAVDLLLSGPKYLQN